LIDIEQYQKAKNVFQSLIKKEPLNAKNFFYLGETYFITDKIDSADLYYKKGIEVNPDEAYNYIGTGKIFLQKENVEAAQEQFKKGISKVPRKDENFYILLGQAWTICKKTNFDEAKKYLDKAKDINEKNPEIYIKYGDLILTKEKTGGDANTQYNYAIDYNPNYAKSYYKIGLVYLRSKIVNNAIESFTKATTLDSNFIPAYRELGEIYLLAKRYDKAVESYKKYISMADYNVNDQIRYAVMLFYNKDYIAANKIVNKLYVTDPNNTNILRLLAYTSYELNDNAKGLEAIIRFFQLIDKSKILTSDYEYYGNILSKNNKDSLAISNYETVIRMDSSKKSLYENIAKIYDKQKNYRKTADYYEKLIKSEQEPLSSQYFIMGKNCYFYVSDDSVKADSLIKKTYIWKADSAFAKVSELSPTSHLGMLWRARSNAMLDPQTTQGLAKPYYEKVVEMLTANTDNKNKKDLIESYKYLGYYYYLKFQNAKGADKINQPQYKESSLGYWQKLKELDPNDKAAPEAIKFLTTNK